MSDYLGNLINRIRDPQRAVRPRLGSVFEPAPGVQHSLSDPGATPSTMPWSGGDLAAESASSLGVDWTGEVSWNRQAETPANSSPQSPGSMAQPIGRLEAGRDAAALQAWHERLRRTISTPAANVQPPTAAYDRDSRSELGARRAEHAAEASGFAQTGGNQGNQAAGGFAQTGGNQGSQADRGNQGTREETGESREIGRESGGNRRTGWQVDVKREALRAGPQAAAAASHPATAAGAGSASPGTDTPGEGGRSQLDPALGRWLGPDEDRPSPGPAARQVAEPHVTLAPRTPAQPALPAARSAELPVIKVTIGRIEVRAVPPVHPPAPARPASRPRPALSLDDYLKQRGGGR